MASHVNILCVLMLARRFAPLLLAKDLSKAPQAVQLFVLCVHACIRTTRPDG